MRSRRRRYVALAAVIGASFLLAGVLRWFVWPPIGSPGRADAIVVLAGDGPTRVPVGVALFDDEYAPMLVVSAGDSADYRTPNPICTNGREGVICPTASKSSTASEIAMLNALADEYNWERILVVTSRFHLTRTRLLFSRCYDGEATVVSSAHVGAEGRLAPIVREIAGVAAALTVRRGC